MTEITFKGRVVIVTGAGAGLGRAYAKELARRGASVVVNDIGAAVDGRGGSTAVAEGVVEEIRAAAGIATPSFDSVSAPEGGARIVATAIEAFGRLDAVICNAGNLLMMPFEEQTAETVDGLIDTHLIGAFNLSQAAYRQMKERGYGRIVFVSSSAGMFGIENQTSYGAAKAGVFGLMKIVALEGAKHGIKANALLPIALTRMATVARAQQTSAQLAPYLPVLGPRMTPDFVAPLAIYLASEACQDSGQAFSALAGRYARLVVGVPSGWFAPGEAPPSVEDLAAHWHDVVAVRDLKEPMDGPGEKAILIEQLTAMS
jgi:NAD(P)-dependent dehydrogenase (short-subunit alcohol dehydrogenase family)